MSTSLILAHHTLSSALLGCKGLLSDVLVRRTGDAAQRVWLLLLVCCLAVASQALAAAPDTINSVHRLLLVSAGTGLCYGTLFGLAPVLTFEWFGLKHFSQVRSPASRCSALPDAVRSRTGASSRSAPCWQATSST